MIVLFFFFVLLFVFVIIRIFVVELMFLNKNLIFSWCKYFCMNIYVFILFENKIYVINDGK